MSHLNKDVLTNVLCSPFSVYRNASGLLCAQSTSEAAAVTLGSEEQPGGAESAGPEL